MLIRPVKGILDVDHRAPSLPLAITRPRLEMPSVSVVIPALNEAANIPHVLPHIPGWVHEVVIVDGNSTDGTPSVARQLWPNRHIVTRERRTGTTPPPAAMLERRCPGITLRLVTQDGHGKGAALRAGFAAATGDIVVMLDADGSTRPEEIPAYVGALMAGADFVKGSRFLQGGGTADMQWYRRAGNLLFVWLVRLSFGSRFSDLCYGYMAFWRHVLPTLDLHADGFEIETLMCIRAMNAGLKITEVASFEAHRIHGHSRLRTFPDGFRVLRTIVAERRGAGTRRTGASTQAVPAP